MDINQSCTQNYSWNYNVNSTVPATLEAMTNSSTFYDLSSITSFLCKDNEVAISHVDFITAVYEAARQAFQGHEIDLPEIRYLRFMGGFLMLVIEQRENLVLAKLFSIRIPSITKRIGGNDVCLSIGGVKSYR